MRTALALGLLLVGCGVDPIAPAEDPVARMSLEPLFGGRLAPVGVAIAPDGKRFVLDDELGLVRLDGETATVIVDMAHMPPAAQPLVRPVTDLVALGPDLFAFTAINDGFLLDTKAMTLKQHFCYLPGDDGTGPRIIQQRTDALTYDTAAQRLWAQPRTYDAAGVFQYAQVAQYDSTSGTDLAWFAAKDDLAATAAVTVPERGLVLGQGPYLLAFDPAKDSVTRLDDLSRYGITSIDGLAFDPLSGVLVVVDGQTDEVVDLDVSRLSL